MPRLTSRVVAATAALSLVAPPPAAAELVTSPAASLQTVVTPVLVAPAQEAPAPVTPPNPPTPPPDAVLVRAVRPDLPKTVIDYIADNAVGKRLVKETAPDAPSKTANDYAILFCGRVTPDYQAAFRRLNKKDAAYRMDQPLGEADAWSVYWPACLATFVWTKPWAYRVQTGQSAPAIYTLLTGSAGTDTTQENYFKRKGLAKIAPGDLLNYTWATNVTRLRPRANDLGVVDLDAFEAGLRSVLEALPGDPRGYARVGADLLKDPGEDIARVVTAADTIDAAGVVTPPAECKDKAPDLQPTAVRYAFIHAARTALAPVKVLVIDNGFYGAAYDPAASTLTVSEKFKGYLVEDAEGGHVGPPVKVEGELRGPMLDPAVIAPSAISGHGTHVAGLVLGGVPLESERAIFQSGLGSWLQLSVANVGNGGRYLPSDALDALDLAVSTAKPDIANVSLVYTKRDRQRFLQFARLNKGTLFVVAAGNDHGQRVGVVGLYPAAIGGEETENYVTVASALPNRQIAAFSNISESFVDLAADGCQLKSWIDMGGKVQPLSGTSQSTPLVVLTASMIRALRKDATPAMIKSRLLVSGDLAQPGADGSLPAVWSYSVLNMAKALYLQEDYIRFWDDKDLVAALGTLTIPQGLGCGVDKPLKSLRAFKKQGGLQVGFTKSELGVDKPCVAKVGEGDRVTFTITHRIDPGAGEVLPKFPQSAPEAARNINLEQVQEFVLRMPK